MSAWRDKTVLITGGSAGLGLTLARAWAAQGARLVLVARGAEALAAAATEIEALGAAVLAVAADITRDDDVARTMAATIERFGSLDVLVNCAGRSMRQAIADTTPEDFQQAWELNFLAAARCTQAALPYLLISRGSVVFIGSLASKTAAPYLGSYPATKFPLAAYAQQLRLELSESGLHALLVCPGPIRRPDANGRYAEQAADLPAAANRPGGGVRLQGLDPDRLAAQILRACERRQAELVVPKKARLLFWLSAVSPRLGDWLVRKMTNNP